MKTQKQTTHRYVRLEDDKLWRQASVIALWSYSQLHNFHEDEAYGMQPRLRDRSFDLTNDIAEATGSIDPRDKAYYYGQALRDCFGIRNTLIMANKTGMLDVEPAVLVQLDALAKALNGEVADQTDDIPEYLRQFNVSDHHDSHDQHDNHDEHDRRDHHHES